MPTNTTQDSNLSRAIKAAAERLRISSQLMIEYGDDPHQLLAAIIDQSETQKRIISDMAQTADICQRQFDRMKELRLKKTTIRIASNGASD